MKVFTDLSWLYDDANKLIITVISTIIIYTVIIIFTRLNGLRTFAKMSSFDFAITIAIGSIIASTMLSGSQSVVQGIVGLATLIALQAFVSNVLKKRNSIEKVITNTPILLMDKQDILEANLKATGVSESELYAKLREANVTNKKQIHAVVLETTGDISVLHNGEGSDELEDELLKYVARTPAEQ